MFVIVRLTHWTSNYSSLASDLSLPVGLFMTLAIILLPRRHSKLTNFDLLQPLGLCLALIKIVAKISSCDLRPAEHWHYHLSSAKVKVCCMAALSNLYGLYSKNCTLINLLLGKSIDRNGFYFYAPSSSSSATASASPST